MTSAGFIFVVTVGIAVWGGCSAWDGYQKHQTELKRLEAVKAVARQETERLRIFAEVLTGRPVEQGNSGKGGVWN